MIPALTDLPDWPRLLPLKLAAAYCQVTPALFEASCPVAPIRLGGRASQQSRRWDRHALDRWLDSLASGRDRPPRRGMDNIYADDDEAEARPAH